MRSIKLLSLFILLTLPAATQFGSNAKKINGAPLCGSFSATDTQVLSWSASGNCWGPANSAGAVTAIGVVTPALDLICAKGNDTTVASLTITGATNAAPPVFTVSSSPIAAGYIVGQTFTVTGVSPSAYNATYTLAAMDSTHLTGSGSAPGSGYTSGGTAYMPCNNSTDAIPSILTVTTATNADPVVFTVSTSPVTAGWAAGQFFNATDATPSNYNKLFQVVSVDSTHVTAKIYPGAGTPGGSYTSGGFLTRVISDSGGTVNFANGVSVPGGTFATNSTLHGDAQYQVFILSGTSQNPGLWYGLSYGTNLIAQTSPVSPVILTGSTPTMSGVYSFFHDLGVRVHSPAAGTLYATYTNTPAPGNGGINIIPPSVVSTAGTVNLTPGIAFLRQGLSSGTYTSGGSISGTVNQTCTLTAFSTPTVTNATATVALTGTNTIAGGTAIVVTNTGMGASGTALGSTSATLGSGTATCSGTAVIATTMGGAQGNGMRLLSFRVWKQ